MPQMNVFQDKSRCFVRNIIVSWINNYSTPPTFDTNSEHNAGMDGMRLQEPGDEGGRVPPIYERKARSFGSRSPGATWDNRIHHGKHNTTNARPSPGNVYFLGDRPLTKSLK